MRILHILTGQNGERWLTLLALLGCVSCADLPRSTKKDMLTEVWIQPGWPPDSMPAPEAFAISPREAYRLVATSKKLSLKHRWFCFRDEVHYYIADAFGKRIGPAAARQGIRVHGITGALE